MCEIGENVIDEFRVINLPGRKIAEKDGGLMAVTVGLR